MKPDISIVVPIYNVEVFLPRCIDSLKNQTHHNIEIILVDDESPDRCGEIAEEYAAKDDRIKVIHQKNKWLGGARNSGLKIATGEYVLFVDSDDYIHEETCEKLLSYVNKMQVDLLLFDFYNVDQEGKVSSVKSIDIQAEKIFRGKEVQELLYPFIISTHTVNSACMKIYKRSVLIDNEIYFDEIIRYAEDYEFCLRLFPVIQSFAYVNKPFYYYIQNDNSIMHMYDPRMVEKFVTLYHFRERFLKRENIASSENEKKSAELLISMLVKTLNRYLGDVYSGTKREKYSQIKNMVEMPEIQEALLRIDVSKMNMGKYGRLIIWGMKNKCIPIIYWLYRVECMITERKQ